MRQVIKDVTVSARIPQQLSDKFDKLSELMKVNKSDFIRACIEKLCKDNRLYLEHIDKVKTYIESIKSAMSKISHKKIIVENGSWKDMNDVTIVMFCDLMFRYSSEVFDAWFDILVNYGLVQERDKNEVREEFSDGLIGIGDIGFILSSVHPITEVEELINEPLWWDELETKKISLLLATKKAIGRFSAEAIIDKVIDATSRFEGEPTVIVLDAQGEFKRSGAVIITPAECEKVSHRKSKASVQDSNRS